MRSQSLYVTPIEVHAGLDKGQVELLGLSALDMFLSPISFTELGEEGSELLVDLGVSVP
jgi:hypothetical protein